MIISDTGAYGTFRERLLLAQALYQHLPSETLDDQQIYPHSDRRELHEWFCGRPAPAGSRFTQAPIVMERIDELRKRWQDEHQIVLPQDYALAKGQLLGILLARKPQADMPIPPCYTWMDFGGQFILAWVPPEHQAIYDAYLAQHGPPKRRCMWLASSHSKSWPWLYPLFQPPGFQPEWYRLRQNSTCEYSLLLEIELDLKQGLLIRRTPDQGLTQLSAQETAHWRQLIAASAFWHPDAAFSATLEPDPRRFRGGYRWDIAAWCDQTFRQISFYAGQAQGIGLKDLLTQLTQTARSS